MNLLRNFNHPAMVKLTQNEKGETIIKLINTKDRPDCILWIAIGLRDSTPHTITFMRILHRSTKTISMV